jgi:hypothetical protein
MDDELQLYKQAYLDGLRMAKRIVGEMGETIILETEYWNGARDILKSAVGRLIAEIKLSERDL